MKKVVIIGGGIIGISTAYYLQKEGCEVSIIDKSDIRFGASFVNAGYVSPSHVVPLAAPGMVAAGIKMMFNPASPFYLKPRFNLDLWQWAWAFNKSATVKHVKEAVSVIKDITVLSRELYHEIKDQKIFDFQYETKGLLMAYQTAKFEDKEAYLAEVAQKQGLEVRHIDKAELSKMEPKIKAEGAYHYTCDVQTTPDEFMQKMRQYLDGKGVKFYLNETVVDFEHNRGTVKKLTTDKQTHTFDELVLASGSWTPPLARKLGVKTLIQAGKGYCINVYRKLGINYPAILTERNTAVSPMEGFTRFGGTMEVAGINTNINPVRIKAIADAIKAFYPSVTIEKEEMDDAACGLRPVSPDGLPFIGRPKRFKNLCIAAGHSMLGWSQGPATGKLISEIITDKKLSLNLNAFNPDRRF